MDEDPEQLNQGAGPDGQAFDGDAADAPFDSAGREPQEQAAEAEDEASSTEAPTTSPSASQELSQGDIDALLNGLETQSDSPGLSEETAAVGSDGETRGSQPPTGLGTKPVALPDFTEAVAPSVEAGKVSMLSDVKLRVKIELGRSKMLVEDVLALGEGSVVELDKLAGDPVDVFVNERLVARGEVLVLNDNFCVRVSEVLSNDPHRISA